MALTRYRSHPLERGVPPGWASSWGEDRYGVFAAFEVQGVEYRMRWIEGGKFVMGSPESERNEVKREAGRFDDEVQHEVELDAFWIGETPVTQALWEAVMGANPSRFKTPDRPVENVSWLDCENFIKVLNERESGLDVRFPTEAQWEYACRAGTTTATYAGDLKILGERNAPLLDRIAWYGGNSGREFELDNGYDTSDWPNKQYPSDKRAGTRRVGEKLPNVFGLHDMLGNVWEWCADWKAPYPTSRARNSKEREGGDGRVQRGGSWRSRARGVRAALRSARPPSNSYDSIGVRLARGL